MALGGVRRADEIRVGLIGCGRRGTGAAAQALAADADVRLVAMADAFADQIEDSPHLERVGGAERVRALRSLRLRGTFELRAVGALGDGRCTSRACRLLERR